MAVRGGDAEDEGEGGGAAASETPAAVGRGREEGPRGVRVCGGEQQRAPHTSTPAHTQLIDAQRLRGAPALCGATHAEEEEGRESVRVNECEETPSRNPTDPSASLHAPHH